jgi:hypothetical protein
MVLQKKSTRFAKNNNSKEIILLVQNSGIMTAVKKDFSKNNSP